MIIQRVKDYLGSWWNPPKTKEALEWYRKDMLDRYMYFMSNKSIYTKKGDWTLQEFIDSGYAKCTDMNGKICFHNHKKSDTLVTLKY